ncbi:MAG: hypothetical protein ACYDCN_12020 [Bacteroidia bacterium]
MATTKTNTKALKALQEKMISRKINCSKAELTLLGIDLSISPQVFGNILLEKDFLGLWSISLKNELHDLDGNPIAENKKLMQIIKANFESGKKQIKFEEMHRLNIWTSKTEHKIGNFRLNSFLISHYSIELIDTKKTVDNLWADAVIDKDKVFEVINKFDILKKDLEKMKELDLNKKLEEHFKNFFATVKKGGTSNKGLVDLVLGDNKFGIELKLARELKKSDQADRAYGQADRYKEEFKSNFMLLLAGSLDEKKEKSLQDLLRKLKDKNVLYYYIEAN